MPVRFHAVWFLILTFCQDVYGAEAVLVHDLDGLIAEDPACGDFREVNGVVLGVLDGAEHGCELWGLTGPGAPRMLTETFPGKGHKRPRFVGGVTNGWQLVFTLSDTYGEELWRTDGTHYQLVEDLSPGLSNTQPYRFAFVPELSRTYFSASVIKSPGSSADRLLSFDGVSLRDEFDHGSPNLQTIASGPERLGDSVVFLASDPDHGMEPRRYDGTTFELIADSVPGSDGLVPYGAFALAFESGIVFDAIRQSGGTAKRVFYRLEDTGVHELKKSGASYPGDEVGYYEAGAVHTGRRTVIAFSLGFGKMEATPIHWMDESIWNVYSLPNSTDSDAVPHVFHWRNQSYALVDGQFYRLQPGQAEKVASPFPGLPAGDVLGMLPMGMTDRAIHFEVEAGDGRHTFWQADSAGTEPVLDGDGEELVDVSAIRPIGQDHYVLARTRERGWAVWKLAGTQPGAHADLAAVSGSWYDPASSGQGFAIQTIDDSTTVVYFYGYRDDGSPLWLIGVGSQPIVEGKTFSVPMNVTSGGDFGDFDPDQVTESHWGTLEITFDGCEAGKAMLSGQDGEQNFDLVRLAGIDGLGCQVFQLASSERAGVSGSWYEPGTAGQGLFLQVFGDDTIIVYFYGYESVEKRLWLIGVHEAPFAMGEWVDIPLNVTSGGSFNGFDKTQVTESPWGGISIRFENCGTAQAKMAGLHGEQTLNLVKLARINTTEVACH